MKSYSRWLLATSLLSAGGSAWSATYNVTFDAGYHGTLSSGNKLEIVEINTDQSTVATPPADPTPLPNFTFIRWSQSTDSVTSDMVVKAVYEKIITIDANSKELVALPLLPVVSTNAQTFFQNALTDTANYVKDGKGAFIRNIDGNWINGVGQLDTKQGYLVYNKSTTPYDLALEGTSFDLSKTISLPQGYAIVPYLFETPMNPNLYFARIISSVDFVKDMNGKKFPNTIPAETLTQLETGKSYLVKLNKARALSLLPPFTPAVSPTTAPIDGATITVTSPYDTDSVTGNPSWADATSNGLTLREAVYFAENLAGVTEETIVFDPNISDIYQNSEITVANAAVFTIDGTAVRSTRTETYQKHRFMQINNAAASITITGMTFDNFDNNTKGGAFYVAAGSASISKALFKNGTANGGGAAIFVDGDNSAAELEFCTFETNTSSSTLEAKGVNSLTVTNSYFKDNSSAGNDSWRAVVSILSGSTANFDSVTFEENQSKYLFRNEASTLNVSNATLLNNTLGTGFNNGIVGYNNIHAVGNTPAFAEAVSGRLLTSAIDPANDAVSVEGVRFYTAATGAYNGYLNSNNAAPAVETALTNQTLEINAAPATLQALFTDSDGTIEEYAISDDSGKVDAITINATGLITIDKTQFTAGTNVEISVTAIDNLGKSSLPNTFTVSFTAPIPPSPVTAPIDGATLEVTSATDTDIEPASGTLADNWTTMTSNGLTLREAVWVAKQLKGGAPETIVFHNTISDISVATAITVNDEAINFTINGEPTSNLEQRITISGTKADRFLHISFGTVTVDNCVIKDFKSKEYGAAFYLDSPSGEANSAVLTVNNSIIKNNVASWAGGCAAMLNWRTNATFNWCEIVDDRATANAAFFNGGTITINNSHIKANALKLLVGNWGTYEIANSTIDYVGDAANIVYELGKNITSTTTNTTYVGVAVGRNTSSLQKNSNPSGTDTNHLHYESVLETDYATINGVRFVNKGDNQTAGAYAGVKTNNTAPTLVEGISKTLVYANDETVAKTADLKALFTDAEHDILTITVAQQHNNITYENGLITVDPSVTPGSYTYNVTATDWNNEIVSTTFTVIVSSVLTVNTADDQEDNIGTPASLGDALSAAETTPGLSLREAISIAEKIDGPEIIKFSAGLTDIILTKELTITSDIIIVGNGANETNINLGTTGQIMVVQGTDDKNTLDSNNRIDLDMTHLRFTGSGITTNANGSMIHINGFASSTQPSTNTTDAVYTGTEEATELIMPHVALKSVELTDHRNNNWTTMQRGGAVYARYANIVLENVLADSLAAEATGSLLYADMSTFSGNAITVVNSLKANVIKVEDRSPSNEPVHAQVTEEIKATLSLSLTYSTFTNNEVNGYAIVPNWNGGGLASFTDTNNTKGTATETLDTSALATRDGVRFISDDGTADSGSDDAAGYNID